MTRHTDTASREAALLQGTLDMLILKILALEPLHGYGIVQRLQQISKDALQIRQGSLYPALYRLENRRWVKAEWKMTDGGREAKYLPPDERRAPSVRGRTGELEAPHRRYRPRPRDDRIGATHELAKVVPVA